MACSAIWWYSYGHQLTLEIALSLGKDLYAKIKKGVAYKAETHCVQIIDTFARNEGLSEFCTNVGICRDTYNDWLRVHKEFRQCAMLARDVGIASWMRLYTEWEPEKEDEKFNTTPWYTMYKKNFGEQNKIALYLSPDATPIDQYKEIMRQAANGDFTTAEIKQVMEAINIGLRAHEVCNLQKDIDELKLGLKKMEERDLEYQSSIGTAPTTDKATLDS